MKRGIVVVEDSETHKALLREAGEYVDGTDSELLLLSFLGEESYESDLETLEAVGKVESVNYDSDAILEAAVSDVRDMVADVFEGLDVEFEVAVAVAEEDERANRVITAGDQYDCDHAFIVGNSRSPAGKALFGDFAQRVILSFDGYVTTATN